MFMKPLNFRLLAVAAFILTALSGLAAVSLVPDYAACQSGGGMGIFSAGPGWRYGSGNRWETEIFLGVVPRHDSKSTKALLALKENFVPWQLSLHRGLALEPLTASLYLTTILSQDFWTRQPQRYPSKYYFLPTRIRINLSVGQRLIWYLPERKGPVKSLAAYYELGTCDIYALSMAGSRELHLSDWMQLCIGIRINFQK